MNMRLLGVRTIDELTPDLVDASALHAHVGLTPSDNLYNSTCMSCIVIHTNTNWTRWWIDQPLSLAQFKPKL